MENSEEATVTICMGSSCFSRGSNRNVEAIQQFVQEAGLEGAVALSGCLCTGHCKKGPVIMINGELIEGVLPEMVPALLSRKLLNKDTPS